MRQAWSELEVGHVEESERHVHVESFAVLVRLFLGEIPHEVVVFISVGIEHCGASACCDVLVRVAEVDVVERVGARIAHTDEVVGEVVELRNLFYSLARMCIFPCVEEEQCLVDAEVGIVETLVHSACAVECARFVLHGVACEGKPFGQVLHHAFGE